MIPQALPHPIWPVPEYAADRQTTAESPSAGVKVIWPFVILSSQVHPSPYLKPVKETKQVLLLHLRVGRLIILCPCVLTIVVLAPFITPRKEAPLSSPHRS